MRKTFDSPGIENITSIFPCTEGENDARCVGIFDYMARSIKNQLIFKQCFKNCYYWVGFRDVKSPKIK